MLTRQGPAGPREAPGPKRDLGEAEHQALKAIEEPKKEIPKPNGGGVMEVTLSNEEVLGLDLAMTRKQAAVAEEKLAMLQLKDAQANLMSAVKGEVVVLAKIANAHKLGNIKRAKLTGNKLIFQKEG